MLSELTYFVEVMSALLQVGLAGVMVLTLIHVGMLIQEEFVIAGGAFIVFFTMAVAMELKYKLVTRSVVAFFSRPQTVKIDRRNHKARHRMEGKLDDETIVGLYYSWRKKVQEDSTEFFQGMLIQQRATAPLF